MHWHWQTAFMYECWHQPRVELFYCIQLKYYEYIGNLSFISIFHQITFIFLASYYLDQKGCGKGGTYEASLNMVFVYAKSAYYLSVSADPPGGAICNNKKELNCVCAK